MGTVKWGGEMRGIRYEGEAGDSGCGNGIIEERREIQAAEKRRTSPFPGEFGRTLYKKVDYREVRQALKSFPRDRNIVFPSTYPVC